MNTFLGHLLHQRLRQARLHCLALGQALAQLKAQAAQLRHAGDDAGLFASGGRGNGNGRSFASETLAMFVVWLELSINNDRAYGLRKTAIA